MKVLVAQPYPTLGDSPPAMQETWVRSLGWEDPLEKGTATHSSILAWRIPWTEEPGRQPSMGSQRSDTTERLSLHFFMIQYQGSFPFQHKNNPFLDYGKAQREGRNDIYSKYKYLEKYYKKIGTSVQCYVAACMGGESGGEWIHAYVWLSPFAVHLQLSQHC